MHDQQAIIAAVDCRNNRETGDIYGTLQAKENGGQSLNYMGAVRTNMTVRRLTPLECSRLQGYPDNWAHIPGWTSVSDEDVAWWTEVHYTNDKITSKNPDKAKRKTEKYIRKWLKNPCSDSAEYKAYGNSIALPQWRYVLGNICEQLGRKATLGSLFDGIGGFPLIWQEINGEGSAKWASEIEPFAIAVTKCRIEG